MVDEAHATGLFGSGRRGLCEESGVSGRVEVQMGTLGKSIGSAGGFICGSRALIDYLVNKARSFVFSTAPPPSQAAAAQAGIEIIQSAQGAELLMRLRENINAFATATSVPIPGLNSPILPVIVGTETAAMEFAEKLLKSGFLVPAIRYPTVKRGQARLRFTFSAGHSAGEIQAIASAVSNIRES